MCKAFVVFFIREREREREIENSIYTNATWRSNHLGRGNG